MRSRLDKFYECRIWEYGCKKDSGRAYRGASGYAPENTLDAFQKAIDMGWTELLTL